MMRILGDKMFTLENSDIIPLDGEGYEGNEVKLPLLEIKHIRKKTVLHVKENCTLHLLVYYCHVM